MQVALGIIAKDFLRTSVLILHLLAMFRHWQPFSDCEIFMIRYHHCWHHGVSRFLMNGKAVCLMSVQMFTARVPLGGKLLYRDFQIRLANALYNKLWCLILSGNQCMCMCMMYSSPSEEIYLKWYYMLSMLCIGAPFVVLFVFGDDFYLASAHAYPQCPNGKYPLAGRDA